MSENYLDNRDDEFLKEMIEYYGVENMPNPDHYPMRFEFMSRSFEHYKRMQERKNKVVVKNDNNE